MKGIEKMEMALITLMNWKRLLNPESKIRNVMKNLHIIPTDKPSTLYKNNELGFKLLAPFDHEIGSYNGSNYHIYITSDEKPKVGDWFIFHSKQMGWPPIVYKHLGLDVNKFIIVHEDMSVYSGDCKKIVLTTDPDLINDGVQKIDDEFLEWFVKNPSCESIKVEDWYSRFLSCCRSKEECYCNKKRIIIPQEELKTSEEWQKQFPNTKVLDPDGWDRKNYQYSWFEEKITLAEYTTRLHKSSVQGLIPQEEPKCYHINTDTEYLGSDEAKKEAVEKGYAFYKKEEPKQETLEEAKDRKYPLTNILHLQLNTAIRTGFEEGAKWMQERMYSESDKIMKFLNTEKELKLSDAKTIERIKWYFETYFEQFKKK